MAQGRMTVCERGIANWGIVEILRRRVDAGSSSFDPLDRLCDTISLHARNLAELRRQSKDLGLPVDK